MREPTIGLGPQIPIIDYSGFYSPFVGEDGDTYGSGFGLFFQTSKQYRFNWVDTGQVWKHSGRKKIRREVADVWRVVRVTIAFGERICNIYVRLWRTTRDEQ